MACAHPIYFDRKFLANHSPHYRIYDYTDQAFPCGRCLNCRVDKQNQLTHRCEYEYIKYKCGAFVTFTYDDPHIQKLMRTDSKGNLNATLSKYDLKKFLDRLNKLVHNQPDNLLCSHKYKYLAVGEYGEHGQAFDRPHFHVLFFGLDFAYCKRLFEKAWHYQGKIDSLPILNGGIRYVLKYLDKQLFGDLAFEKYDKNNLQRPFQQHSLGLGAGLYKEQLAYIKTHNNCYRWRGKDVPVPTYYRNKYLLSNRRFKNINKIKNRNRFNLTYGVNLKNNYDLHDYSITKAQIRERNLLKQMENNGQPRFDFYTFATDSKIRKDYISTPLAALALQSG